MCYIKIKLCGCCYGDALFIIQQSKLEICCLRALQSTYFFPRIVLGVFHECLICCLGGEEEMPAHPLARYEYFKLYEITGNLELVSEITW